MSWAAVAHHLRRRRLLRARPDATFMTFLEQRRALHRRLCGSSQGRHYDKFVADFAARAARLLTVGGNPEHRGPARWMIPKATRQGQLLHRTGQAGRRRSLRCGTDGVDERPRTASGSSPRFCQRDVTRCARSPREEIFGPVPPCIIRFKTEEEAVAIANDTPSTARVLPMDQQPAARIRPAIQSQVRPSSLVNVRDLRQPFGGSKVSRHRREGVQPPRQLRAVLRLATLPSVWRVNHIPRY